MLETKELEIEQDVQLFGDPSHVLQFLSQKRHFLSEYEVNIPADSLQCKQQKNLISLIAVLSITFEKGWNLVIYPQRDVL